jgi:hypothetical protein
MHLLDGSRNWSTSRIADLLRDNAVIPATFSPDPRVIFHRLEGRMFTSGVGKNLR